MNTKMLDIMMSEAASGVEEVPGPKSNPRIMEYLNTTTIRATDDITPWCSACVNWVAVKAGYKGTDSAASATWRNWGRKLNKPTRGCVIGFVRNDGSGHVGIFISEDSDNYTILGGNQSDKVGINRFAKTKSKEPRDWYFRAPKTLPTSKTGGASIVGGAVIGGMSLEELTKEFRATKDRMLELQQDVAELKDPTVIDIFTQAMPVLVIVLFGYIVYERWKKIKSLGV